MFLYSASLEKHMEAYAQEVKMQELNELRQLAANKITRQSELFNISQFENMQKIQALLSQPVREEVVKQPEKKIIQKKDLTVDTSTSPKSQKASPKKSPLINELEEKLRSRASSIASNVSNFSPTSSFATTMTSTTAQAPPDIGKTKDTRGMAKPYKKKGELESEIKKIISNLNIASDEKANLAREVSGLKRDELETFRKNLEADYGATNSSAFNIASGLRGKGIRKGIRRARR